jgi:hypothetical protein
MRYYFTDNPVGKKIVQEYKEIEAAEKIHRRLRRPINE